MLRLDDITLSPGGHDVLRGATWHLRAADHAGLIGRNGAGKTTLLRAMVGELSPETGQIHRRGGLRLGWLPQQAVSGSTDTVWNEVRSRMEQLQRLESAVQAAQTAVEADAPGAVERLGQATEAFRLAGGYAAEERIGEVLHGLGFAPDTWHRRCDTFSGGWQMRIALARLLLSQPDVALLDEPTNHLDLEARGWLGSFLSNAPWAFVLVSHDRHLLDRCVTRIVEVRGKRIHTFSGTYGRYLVERQLRTDQQASAYTRQQAEVARLEGFVERFRYKATKAAQAQSRVKQLERMERIDAPEAPESVARIRLPEAPPGALQAIELRAASVGWTEDTPVLEGLDLTLERGMRLVLLGPNGCGKSTILQTLAGTLRPLAGRRVLGDRTRIGVFTQDSAADLPAEQRGLDWLVAQAPTVSPQRLRAVLGALGLPGDASLRLIDKLSGGETARVALAALMARPHNALLLDEPSNHLDVQTVEVLVQALANFDGALLLVTHDRYLVEQVATHVGRIVDGRLEVHEGVLPSDFEPAGTTVSQGEAVPSEAALSYAERKKQQRELERAKKRLGSIDGDIEAAEGAVADLDDQLVAAATDYTKATSLGAERDAAQAVVDGLYAEWEQLEALLERA